MLAHVVLYKTNLLNQYAAEMIIYQAKKLLLPIWYVNEFFVGQVVNMGRAVNNAEYQVMLMIMVKDEAAYSAYMQHPKHREFVSFVLRGYKLENSTSPDPSQEFIDYILGNNPVRKWVRDSSVRDADVVWGGESVIDAVH